jgi:hypothetical protein
LHEGRERGMDICQFVISIVVAVVFSDVAAVFTTLAYQRKQAKKARLTSLCSLVNEVERIEKVTYRNTQLKPRETIQPVTRLPVAAFETAFVSGRPGLVVREELKQVVADYLVRADSINSLIDIYPASISRIGTGGTSYTGHIIDKIIGESMELIEVIKRLKSLLDTEVAHA